VHKRCVRFVQYCLRMDCLEKMSGTARLVGDVLDELKRSHDKYIRYERQQSPNSEYWKGYSDAIRWLIK